MSNSSLDKDTIINFFNEKSFSWDIENTVDYNILDLIFDNGSFINNKSLLDIGCGTGILFDYYLAHNASSITGIDLSNNMIDRAKEKYPNIELVCADACSVSLDKQYDLIVIYNTLPHIYNIYRLFDNCKKHLKIGGYIIVAFGQCMKETNNIHNSLKERVSNPLMPIEDLANIMANYFSVVNCISNNDRYEIICVNKG